MSKFILGGIGRLDLLSSRNDKFTIKEVNDIVSEEATFTNFQVTSLTNSMQIKASSGDVFVSAIEEGFDHIKLNNVFSTINLGIEKTKHFTIETRENIFTSYDYPSGLFPIKSEVGTGSYFLMGDKNKAGKIEIKCESCKVYYDY